MATQPTMEDIKSRLLPNQKELWDSLKKALLEVENGTAQGRTWANFKNRYKVNNHF